MARFIRLEMPFEIFTGKLDRVTSKANSTMRAQYFISQHKWASGLNYFAVRKGYRTTEFTQRENELQSLFKQAQINTTAALQDPTKAAAYKAQFKAQKKYSTLRGFVFAKEYKTLIDGE